MQDSEAMNFKLKIALVDLLKVCHSLEIDIKALQTELPYQSTQKIPDESLEKSLERLNTEFESSLSKIREKTKPIFLDLELLLQTREKLEKLKIFEQLQAT